MDKKENPLNGPEMKPKLEKAVSSMAAKAGELGWSPKNSQKEVQEAIDHPKFVYLKMEEDGYLCVQWGAEKVGFGEITFHTKDGKLYCHTECMGKDFVMAAMLDFLKTQVIYE